ncbi:MAG: hypothetical protein KDD69_16005 [Bdellovibrionales bacterium]|nr:hypothetical protein [Bdellovibrionales bacterium]
MSTLPATQITQRYLREHPSVADCLERNLINLSALAREICAHADVDAFDAVLIACRRYRSKQRARASHEARVRKLITSAKVRVRTKLIVATVEPSWSLAKRLELQTLIREEGGDFNLIEGEASLTVITNAEHLPHVRRLAASRLLRVAKDVVQIAMLFGQSLETTSGVVAHLYRLFAGSNINIIEEMSCWNEVMMIIDQKDLARAMELLSN